MSFMSGMAMNMAFSTDEEIKKINKRLAKVEQQLRSVREIVYCKEQDAVEPKVSSTEQRCGNCNKVIEMDGWIACPWCGKPIAWNGWWNKNGGQAVKLNG